MSTLLKDMPECMEKIENNSTLVSSIKDELIYDQTWNEDQKDFVLNCDSFEEVSERVVKKLTDFINTNYTWKGIKN